MRASIADGAVDASRFQPNPVNFKPTWGYPLIAKLLVVGTVLPLVIGALLLWIIFLGG